MGETQSSKIVHLPNEMLEMILRFATLQELKSLRLVCSRFRDVSGSVLKMRSWKLGAEVERRIILAREESEALLKTAEGRRNHKHKLYTLDILQSEFNIVRRICSRHSASHMCSFFAVDAMAEFQRLLEMTADSTLREQAVKCLTDLNIKFYYRYFNFVDGSDTLTVVLDAVNLLDSCHGSTREDVFSTRKERCCISNHYKLKIISTIVNPVYKPSSRSLDDFKPILKILMCYVSVNNRYFSLLKLCSALLAEAPSKRHISKLTHVEKDDCQCPRCQITRSWRMDTNLNFQLDILCPASMLHRFKATAFPGFEDKRSLVKNFLDFLSLQAVPKDFRYKHKVSNAKGLFKIHVQCKARHLRRDTSRLLLMLKSIWTKRSSQRENMK